MWEGYTTARTRVYSHQRMCAQKVRLVFDLNGLCPKGHAIEDGTAELVGQALGDAVLLKLDLGRRRITV